MQYGLGSNRGLGTSKLAKHVYVCSCFIHSFHFHFCSCFFFFWFWTDEKRKKKKKPQSPPYLVTVAKLWLDSHYSTEGFSVWSIDSCLKTIKAWCAKQITKGAFNHFRFSRFQFTGLLPQRHDTNQITLCHYVSLQQSICSLPLVLITL